LHHHEKEPNQPAHVVVEIHCAFFDDAAASVNQTAGDVGARARARASIFRVAHQQAQRKFFYFRLTC
jgi:hypothetical protein